MQRFATIVGFFALAACGDASKPQAEPEQPVANAAPVANGALAASPASPEPAAGAVPAPAKPVPVLAGKFPAGSKTAMSVTGDLTVSAGRFKFEFQDYIVGEPSAVDAKAASPSGESWASVLTVPDDATVMIWPVTRFTVAKGAPNGDLCGPDPTRFLVTATPGTGGSLGLHVGAYSSAKGDAAVADTTLCGVYNYDVAGG